MVSQTFCWCIAFLYSTFLWIELWTEIEFKPLTVCICISRIHKQLLQINKNKREQFHGNMSPGYEQAIHGKESRTVTYKMLGIQDSHEIKEMQIKAVRYHFHLLPLQKLARWLMPSVSEMQGNSMLFRRVVLAAALLTHSLTVLGWIKCPHILWSSNATHSWG